MWADMASKSLEAKDGRGELGQLAALGSVGPSNQCLILQGNSRQIDDA